MGYYIETDSAKGKAAYLIKHHAAELIGRPAKFEDVPADKALVCVVQGMHHDAAALCHDKRTYQDCSQVLDNRSRVWLLMNREEAHKLAGYTPPSTPKKISIFTEPDQPTDEDVEDADPFEFPG